MAGSGFRRFSPFVRAVWRIVPVLLGVDPDFFRFLAVNVRGDIPFLSRVSVRLRGGGHFGSGFIGIWGRSAVVACPLSAVVSPCPFLPVCLGRWGFSA